MTDPALADMRRVLYAEGAAAETRAMLSDAGTPTTIPMLAANLPELLTLLQFERADTIPGIHLKTFDVVAVDAKEASVLATAHRRGEHLVSLVHELLHSVQGRSVGSYDGELTVQQHHFWNVLVEGLTESDAYQLCGSPSQDQDMAYAPYVTCLEEMVSICCDGDQARMHELIHALATSDCDPPDLAQVFTKVISGRDDKEAVDALQALVWRVFSSTPDGEEDDGGVPDTPFATFDEALADLRRRVRGGLLKLRAAQRA